MSAKVDKIIGIIIEFIPVVAIFAFYYFYYKIKPFSVMIILLTLYIYILMAFHSLDKEIEDLKAKTEK